MTEREIIAKAMRDFCAAWNSGNPEKPIQWRPDKVSEFWLQLADVAIKAMKQ